MVAALLLALCNTTMSDLSSIGIEGLLYLSPGNLICGLMYCSVQHMQRTFKGQEGGLTNTVSQSMQKEEGKMKKQVWDTVLFLFFTAVYFGTQLSIVLSFSYSQKAGVNEGIITSVWAVTPLFGSLFDYLIFGVKLS